MAQIREKQLFQIGEVAKMFNLSVGSIRHYEKIGLITPEYIDENTGYRYYGIRQFECLNTIRYLRVLDMPLEKIADFIQNRDIEKITDMLKQQKIEVVQKQKELKMIEKKINNRLEFLKDALSSELDSIRIKCIPAHNIALIKKSLTLNSYLDLEESIRILQHKEQDSLVFLGKVGVGIEKEHLQKGEYDRYDMAFLLLDREDKYQGDVITLEEQSCVTIRFRGGHKEAGTQYAVLDQYIKENGFEIIGSSREITLIDNGLTADISQFVTEIQIPVEVKTSENQISENLEYK